MSTTSALDTRALEPIRTSELHWRSLRGLRPRFELVADDRFHASLDWQAAWSAHARFETVLGTWTIRRVGFLRPHVSVRDERTGDAIATFHFASDGGTIELRRGARYRWRCASFAKGRWEVLDAFHEHILEVHVGGSGLAPHARVELVASALEPRTRDLLVGLAWFLIVLEIQDVEAVAAAVTASV